ncbi:cytochrome c biogenesis protein ResB, partial [bacterium]|nr:cytochrome c biogenesis protein ResB [bacterium]
MSIWGADPLKWLFSLKTGLALLVVLTVASIVGTLIDPLEKAQALIYYSGWYLTFLLLLAVNVGCATVRHIKERILPARGIQFRKQKKFYEVGRPRGEVPFQGTVEDAARVFARHGLKTATEEDFGYGWRGKLGYWGAPLAHFGIILVLVSGFVSKWVAREGFVVLGEGERTDKLIVRGDEGMTAEDLGFTVICEDFDTGFFPR